MKVPFLSLDRLHAPIRQELDAAVSRVIDTSAFVGAKHVRAFEEAFAEAHDAPAAAGCNSGTDALALALRALGVGPGDEVVVPSMTFIATAEAVLHIGAKPVLADVDAETLLLTDDALAAVRTERTKAVVPVHLYGGLVGASAIEKWRADGLIVVEDAAQAHLATEDGRFAGASSDAATFSFFPGKNLGAFGDAGAVISTNTELIDEVKRLRDHGRTSKYRHDVLGYSSRMDGIQAAILETKLRYLPGWTAVRRTLAADYVELLGDASSHLVPFPAGSAHHLFVTRWHDRDLMARSLQEEGIGTGIHYPLPLSQQPSLGPLVRSTPVAESAARSILSLPIDPTMTRDDVAYVCDRVMAALPSQPDDEIG